MARPVTLKIGQYLVLLLAVAAMCVGGGMLLQAFLWRLPTAARSTGLLIMLGGQIALVVVMIWKSVDDWAERTGYNPPRRT